MIKSSAKGRWMVYFLLAVFLFTLPLQACTPAAPSEPDHLKMAVFPYLSFAPLYLAQAEGFFTEENLEVEFIRFDNATNAFTALVQGDIDVIGETVYPALFNMISGDSNVKIVADRGHLAADGCAYQAFLVTPAWLERYNASPAEALLDVRISIHETNYEGFIFAPILMDAGLTFGDVDLTEILPPSSIDAVQNDAIDILSAIEPWTTRLLDTGLVTYWKGGHEIAPETQVGTLLFGPNLLEEDPDVGIRFMKAYLRGVAMFNQGTTDRNLEILTEALGLDTGLLQRTCWPTIFENGMVNLESIDAYQEWALSLELIESIVPVESYWDPSFIEEAGK
jgi:NitT/TauT family transport system substrate-binding protein